MEDGGWQSEEEGRLHFRDPCSGYTVIPRDVEGRKEMGRETEREKGKRGLGGGRGREKVEERRYQ